MTMTMMAMTATAQAEPLDLRASDPVALAGVIHDDVLQSLGVAVLGVDLCQRFHERMRYEQALAELAGIVEALRLALASSEQLLPYLNRHLTGNSPVLPRPGPALLNRSAEPRAAGPQAIVETLIACESEARRCRSQYDAGLGADTMRDLELMLQRLEFVSTTFREVMGQLRRLAGRAIVPHATAASMVVVGWRRSA